jgi:hypothetical protein
MRFWLIVFLSILMSLQISWAATSRYCQHESDVSSAHFGHHSHRHQATELTDSNGDVAKAIAIDLDCVTCHVSSSMASQEPDVIQKMALALVLAPQLIARLSPAPEDRPERPKWVALV